MFTDSIIFLNALKPFETTNLLDGRSAHSKTNCKQKHQWAQSSGILQNKKLLKTELSAVRIKGLETGGAKNAIHFSELYFV
jgi:hypothetical protein